MAPMLNVPTPETQRPEREAILARLERLHPRIIDLSLGRIRRLLQAMDRPEQRLPPVVHIAGTNGKGSTLAFMRAALEAEGYRVHVYTSPHLVNFNERIRLDGAIIDDPTLRAVLEETERANDGQPITFFEVTTAAAFLAFADVPADILLLETGLGGRLDATNVIDRPLLTAISPVSFDHQQFLGTQLAGIAAEKAGILKREVPAVLGPQRSVAAQAIEQRASEIGAPLFAHGDAWIVEQKNGALTYRSDIGAYDLPLPNLAGVHQVINAGLAVACLERLDEFRLGAEAFAQGILTAEWPGRLQRLSSGPLCDLAPPHAEIWLDGGHNAGAGEALAETLATWDTAEAPPLPLYLVFGMLESKDPQSFLAPFVRFRPTILSVPVPGNHSSLRPEDCRGVARNLGFEAHAFAAPEDALRWLRRQGGVKARSRILICGSLYLVGTVLADNA